MRYFALLDLQHMVLALFLGLGLVVLLYAAWMGYREREPEESAGPPGGLEGTGAAEAGGVETGEEEHRDNPIPPMLILLYTVVAVWMVSYLMVVGIRGGPTW
jgi:hypothetical protein